MPKLKKMSRRMRKELIVYIVGGSPEPMRLTEIARAQNLTRSPYLRTLLSELVEEGRLLMEWVTVTPDIEARVYTMPRFEKVV